MLKSRWCSRVGPALQATIAVVAAMRSAGLGPASAAPASAPTAATEIEPWSIRTASACPSAIRSVIAIIPLHSVL